MPTGCIHHSQIHSSIDLVDAASSGSVTATRGGAAELTDEEGEVGPAIGMGWDVEGGQVLKPPRNSSISTGDACIGCPAADGAQRKPSIQSPQEASDAALFQHHHACGGANPDNIPGDGPVPLAPFGTSAISIRSGSAAAGVHMHKRGGGGMELEPEAVVVTPLASAGAGDVGAEHDATPLQSRHKGSARSGGGFGSPRSSSGGGGGGGGGDARGETASDGAASVSGVDDSLSSVGEGPGGLKRKDTITWESFLANITVTDEAKEAGGGAKGAEAAAGACSDSSPPVAMRLTSGAASEGVKGLLGSAAEQPLTARTRYLRAMASNAGDVRWNDDLDDEDRNDDCDGDGDSDGDTESAGLPELSEGQLVHRANVQRLLSDLSDRTFSPRARHPVDLGRSQSMSSVGMGSINSVRKIMERGVNKFNVNPKDGIAYLIDNGLVTDSAQGICSFLCSAEGLSKRRLGEYFGRDNPKAQEVLRLFLKELKFKNASLDEALRAMVMRFRLPGEAQQMDRIMESFAVRYHEENPYVFSCSDTAWVLAFGLMMLNTDMYNRNIKESDKMTEAEFVKNHRGIDQGKDPAKELLEGMYRRIKASEIRMAEGDMYESEVITFVAPKKSGWLKKKSTGYVGKWKRHWFVLNDAVLYYFLAPQHQDEAPRCIIPLEGINISPIGATDLSIGLRTNQGFVKSVKMADNGTMQQGTHRSFTLRADTNSERDIWVDALRAEVPAFHMELSASRSLSATPATSSAPTPIGTPSESGRRSGKFSASGRTRRRATIDLEASSKMQPPVIRGWARTQSDQHQSGGRRYIALFRDIGPDQQDNVIYFFGDAAMCDKMIEQHLRTSHGSLNLSDVTRVQLQQEEGGGGGRAIALQTGAGKHVKEVVIVPEEQREFLAWTRNIKECCPGSAYSIAADCTPSASVGATAFPSVNTVDSNGDGVASSVSVSVNSAIAIADHIGLHDPPAAADDVFVSVGIPATSTTESVAGTADGKGQGEGAAEGSELHTRSESSVTQPVDAAAAAGAGGTGAACEVNRVNTTPSAETEAYGRFEHHAVSASAPEPQSPPRVGSASRIVREGSMPGTDVE
ncbi:pleckstrin homology (PH) domain-containing protein [Ectocarpus siliculosus]|uniref:Pleckstrin homology (PH) domain-containing protein n=1 Tax=Ectocarpus siliculosus TaxID=2880 RepID=D8LK46_ECTSI|nr:pleckstrin homology (PH) domain-containing protein [Ectocarpus siliculosus]|eukprot:CBN74515.1 pleckstrin homology (PH) domain-containing protein [Ectocarpus siliculosus]